MTLLENAKNAATGQTRAISNVDAEVVELAMAYARHEVSQSQVASALSIPATKVANRMYQVLKDAVRAGMLK